MTQEERMKEFLKYWHDISPDNEHMVKAYVTRAVSETRRYIKMAYEGNVPSPADILEDYNLNFKREDQSTVSLSNFYLVRTAREVMKRPEILFDTFERVKNVKEFWNPVTDASFRYKYTSDREGNWKKIAHDVFHNFWDENGSKFEKDKVLRLTAEEKAKLIPHLKLLLSDASNSVDKKLTFNYINGIINSVSSLYDLGVLEPLVEKNNADRKQMGLDVLSFDLEPDNNSSKYAVENLLDEGFLKNFSFEKLAVLHAFYSNRLKKVSNTLGLGFFICNKLDMLDGSTGNFDINEAMHAYVQYMALNGLFMATVPTIYDNIDEYRQEGVYEGKRYVGADSNKVYKNLIKPFSKVYSVLSRDKSSLDEDFFVYLCTQVTDYWQKDFSMEMLLLTAMEKFGTTNWGYIPEEDNRGVNSIIRRKDNILLGFDVAGFNMPVRLHMPVEKVRMFFGNFDRSYEIPNYIGNEDMEIWGKNMGVSVLMPLSPQHRKSLIATVKKMSPNSAYYSFARHIEGMQYDNNLFRVQKRKDPNGRKGARSYTNVLTGEVATPSLQKV